MLQQERDEVLSCDQKKIRELAPMVKAITDTGIICAVGNESKIQQAEDNFKTVTNLL